MFISFNHYQVKDVLPYDGRHLSHLNRMMERTRADESIVTVRFLEKAARKVKIYTSLRKKRFLT